jgi:peroxiredoxin
LKELKGKRVVLSFFATWSPPCEKEASHFVKLRSEIPEDELVIMGISSEDSATLSAFIKKYKVNYPVISVDDLPAPFKDVPSEPTTFFIDRQGVIQDVLVGYRDFDVLKERAMAKDFEGEAKLAPAPRTDGLKEREPQLKPTEVWSKNLPGAQALCAGDWDADGVVDILVADPGKLHVFGLDGVEKKSVPLPEQFALIECGRHNTLGARLVGYSNWGQKVSVMDATGKQLWSYGSFFGVNGAHWGDLDGDGTDELLVGMNGGGGLHAVSAAGKKLWVARMGNVWNQAVISASTNRSAVVLATEAGGSVRIFDGQGKPLGAIRPDGKYYAQMSAAQVDNTDSIQIVALGDGDVIAFDRAGRVAWSAPSVQNQAGWRETTFASGDIDGDGRPEWTFADPNGDLVLATATGEKLGALTGQANAGQFIIVPSASGRGLLILINGGTVRAYSFE